MAGEWDSDHFRKQRSAEAVVREAWSRTQNRFGLGNECFYAYYWLVLPKRRSFNPKRRIATAAAEADLERLASEARYTGSPYHKRNPGDFGLTPPASPRPDKTLCDLAGVSSRREADDLLKAGIRRGFVSQWSGRGYPDHVWAVSANGVAFEAQLENPANHGYPLTKEDPLQMS